MNNLYTGENFTLIESILAWHYWVQLLMLASMAAILVISRLSDEQFCRKALFIVSMFVAAFAVHVAYRQHDALPSAFFGLLAAVGTTLAHKSGFGRLSVKDALAAILVILALITLGFGVFSHVYFDDRLTTHSPFRLYFNGYVQWGIFLAAAAFFTSRYIRGTARPLTEARRYAASTVIMAFWVTFFGVKVLDGQSFARYFLFDAITQHVYMGIGPNATNKDGETRLHNAAETGDLAQVIRLVEKGADPNAQSRHLAMRTPFTHAIYNNQFEVFNYLLYHGANVNLADTDNQTPLHFAVQNKNEDVRYIAFLLDRGADLHARNQFGSQAIHLAAEGDYSSAEQRFLATDALIELLVQRGANINDPQGQVGTPLHMAVSGGNSAAVKKLIELGADPSIRNKNNETPLEMAVKRKTFNEKLNMGLSALKAKEQEEIIPYLQEAQARSTGECHSLSCRRLGGDWRTPGRRPQLVSGF